MNLDDFKEVNELSDEHIDYLYEQSYGRQIEKNYDYQIEQYLAEEKAKEEKHDSYVKKNYIRIGGN